MISRRDFLQVGMAASAIVGASGFGEWAKLAAQQAFAGRLHVFRDQLELAAGRIYRGPAPQQSRYRSPLPQGHGMCSIVSPSSGPNTTNCDRRPR